MKRKNLYLIYMILAFGILFCSSATICAQDTAQELQKKIADADKERIRLLQEQLDIIEKRNTELAEQNRKLRENPNEPVASTDSSTDEKGADKKDVDKKDAVKKDGEIKKPLTNGTGDIVKNDSVSGKTNIPPLSEAAKKVDEKSLDKTFQPIADAKCSIAEDKIELYSRFRAQLCRLINDIKPEGDDTSLTISFAENEDVLVRLVAAKTITDNDSPKLLAARNFLLKNEKVRTDKQIGADSKNKGTTSIVSKGGIPALFGFAVENGGATSTVDGTSMTFRVNPAGFFQAITGSSYAELFAQQRSNKTLDFFSKVSLGFTFDTTRGSEVDMPVFTGSESQLSAFSFRYEFINQRSPKSTRFRKLWTAFVANQGQAYTEKQTQLFKQIYVASDRRGRSQFSIPELQDTLNNVNAKLKAAETEIRQLIADGKDAEATDKIENIVTTEFIDKLPVTKIRSNPAFTSFVASVELDEQYVDARNELFDEIAEGQVATFEYINFREPIKPDTHSLKFIWEKGLYRGIDFTLNASATFYNRKPNNPDVRRLRDFDFSGQFDFPLRRLDIGLFKDSVFSFAAKYQRLNTDIINDAGIIMPGTKGDIALGQGKLVIPIGDTGLKIPISFTFANRTELIKEKEVRANFGITIDFDAIWLRLKSMSPVPLP
jgi:hypothetical protein